MIEHNTLATGNFGSKLNSLNRINLKIFIKMFKNRDKNINQAEHLRAKNGPSAPLKKLIAFISIKIPKFKQNLCYIPLHILSFLLN